MIETKSTIFPLEIVPLFERIKLGEHAAYDRMVELLADECRSRGEGKRYFPISVMREACRQYLRQMEFDPSDKIVFYKVFSDAILSAMTANDAPDISRLGRALRDIILHLDGSDPDGAILLRLQYIVGLNWNEIRALPQASEQLVLPEKASLALGLELKARGLAPELMQRQNLRPRGEVTQLLEDVRDGQRPLGDVVVHERLKLRRQAEDLLRLEDGNISLQADDLVNEMFLRMPKAAHKSPANHMEFEALAKRIMRHILIDRARKPIPGQARFSDELREGISTSSAFVEDRLLWEKVAQVVDEVIKELRQTDVESAEMLHATLFGDVDQKYLAKLYDVSVSTVKRRVKEGRDRIRKRLGVDLKR